MTSAKLRRSSSWNSNQKQEYSAESVIEELREKMSRIKFRLLDCQNQNQMLRKELLLAKKVIHTEVTKASDEDFQDLLNRTDFRGRQEKILILKDKLKELQNRIKELEDGNTEKSPEDVTKIEKIDKLEELKTFQSKKMISKEMQYLLENSCQMKRKIEIWKKRNAELNKEVELLRLELNQLLEKSKEDKNVHESYRAVDKELRARQSEKLDMRSKLDLEKTRNEQLAEELTALQEDLSMVLSKINDDKVLIDALKNQQGYLIDLLERQKFICESDNRKFQDDLREMQARHATNRHVLDHLKDIVEEKTQACQQVQKSMKDETTDEEEKREESTVTTVTDSNLTSQDESSQSSQSSQPSSSANELPSDNEVAPTENEISTLKEELEQCKNIFQSVNEEIEQLTHIVFCNNNKLNEWIAQLLQTNSLLAQKNAELLDLKETSRKIQKVLSVDKKDPSTTERGSNFTDEMQKKYDVLEEEYQFLLTLRDLLISNKENSLEIFFIVGEFTKKQFTDAIFNFISEDHNSDVAEEAPESEDESSP